MRYTWRLGKRHRPCLSDDHSTSSIFVLSCLLRCCAFLGGCVPFASLVAMTAFALVSNASAEPSLATKFYLSEKGANILFYTASCGPDVSDECGVVDLRCEAPGAPLIINVNGFNTTAIAGQMFGQNDHHALIIDSKSFPFFADRIERNDMEGNWSVIFRMSESPGLWKALSASKSVHLITNKRVFTLPRDGAMDEFVKHCAPTVNLPGIIVVPGQRAMATTPPPQQNSSENLELESRRFIERHVDALNYDTNVSLRLIENDYADWVLIDGKSWTRQQLMNDTLDFQARWPRRQYAFVPDTVSAECFAPTRSCNVSGNINWTVISQPRHSISIGAARWVFGLQKQQARFIITSQNEIILWRRVRKYVRGGNRHQHYLGF
jgi:hypothetical protein